MRILLTLVLVLGLVASSEAAKWLGTICLDGRPCSTFVLKGRQRLNGDVSASFTCKPGCPWKKGIWESGEEGFFNAIVFGTRRAQCYAFALADFEMSFDTTDFSCTNAVRGTLQLIRVR